MADLSNYIATANIDEIMYQNSGEIPNCGHAGRLARPIDVQRRVGAGLFQFISVAAPSDEDGGAELNHLRILSRSVGESLHNGWIAFDKSTVPARTTARVNEITETDRRSHGGPIKTDSRSNPGFLTEGAAIHEFAEPDRIGVSRDTSGMVGLTKQDASTVPTPRLVFSPGFKIFLTTSRGPIESDDLQIDRKGKNELA